MSSITSYLERRAHAKNSELILFTEDGLTIAATAGLGLSHVNAYRELDQFKNWEADFSDNFSQKMNEFKERRFADLEEYRGLVQDESNLDTEEAQRLIKSLRDDDVRSRWGFEKFFAEEGSDGANRVLGYQSYEKGETAYNIYSEEQFSQLVETGKVTVDETTLQGHHIKNISSNITDTKNLEELFNVDNIKLMTREAHLHDPTHGHGGSWQNPTTGDGNEVTGKYEDIVDANKDIANENISTFNLYTGIGVGVVVGVITSVIEINKLKNDPRPWKKKALLITTSAFLKGLEAGTLALLALKTRTAISSLGESEAFQSNIEYVNNILTNALPGDLSSSLDAENLASYAGFSVSIAELRIIRSGIVAIVQWRKSDFRTASNQLGKELMVIIPEETVFFGTAFMLDMLYQAGEDALIPDPTGGFIIAARIGWSVGKKGYQYNENKKTMKICKERRMDGLYETAITSLVYFG